MRGALRRGLWLAAFVAAGMALAWSGWLEHTGALVPRCPFHALTGLWCPGCGGTRAAMRLLHLDLPGALHYHAPAVLAAPALAFVLVAHGNLRLLTGRPWLVYAALAGLVVFAILRNLPWAPLSWLAPLP